MIYLNNNFTLKTEIESKEFFFGYGCYEIIKGKGNELFNLNWHKKNLKKNMDTIELKREFDLEGIIYEYIRLKHMENISYYIYIMVSDKTLYVDMKEIDSNMQNVSFGIIKNVYHNELSHINTLNQMTNYFAEKELKKNMWNIGIFQNRQGIITNIINGNVFLIKDQVLKTPSKNLNIFEGIDRDMVFETAKQLNLPVENTYLTEKDVVEADNVFFTSATNLKLIHGAVINDKKYNSNNLMYEFEKQYLKKIENML